jgi:hypothetical protein
MWFEMADMLHKLTLTSLLFFVSDELQMPFGMLVTTVYTILILYFRPYVRKGDDRLHLFVQIELFLVIQAGFILFTTAGTTLDYETDVLLSAVLITVTIALVLIFLLMAFKNIRKMLRQRERKREEEAMLENALEMTPEDRAAMHRKEMATQEEWEEYKTAEEVVHEIREKEEAELAEFEVIKKMLTGCCQCCSRPNTEGHRRWRKVLLNAVYAFKCCMRGCETEAMTKRRQIVEEREAKRLREEGTPVLKVDSTGRPMWVKQRASAGGRGTSRLLDIQAELKKNPHDRLSKSGSQRGLGFSVDRRSTSADDGRRSTGTPKNLRGSLRSSTGGFRNSKENGRGSKDSVRGSKEGPKGSIIAPLFPDLEEPMEGDGEGDADANDSDFENENKDDRERRPREKEEAGVSMIEKLRRDARAARAGKQKRYADDEPEPAPEPVKPVEPKSPKGKKGGSITQSRESLVRQLDVDELLAEHEIGNMRARKEIDRQRRLTADEGAVATTTATAPAKMTRAQFFAKEFGDWETHPGEEAKRKKAEADKKAAEDAVAKENEAQAAARRAKELKALEEAAEAARQQAIAHERGLLDQELTELTRASGLVLSPLSPAPSSTVVTPADGTPSSEAATAPKRRDSFEHVTVTEVDPNAPVVIPASHIPLSITPTPGDKPAVSWTLPPPPHPGSDRSRQVSRGNSRTNSRTNSRANSRANSRRSSPERNRQPQLSAEAAAERQAMLAEFAGMRPSASAPLTSLRPPSPGAGILSVPSRSPTMTTTGSTGSSSGSGAAAIGSRSRRGSFDNTVVLSEQDHHSSEEDTPTVVNNPSPSVGITGRRSMGSRGHSRQPSRQPLMSAPVPSHVTRPRVLSADETDEQNAMFHEFASLRAAVPAAALRVAVTPPLPPAASTPSGRDEQKLASAAAVAATRRHDDDDDGVVVQELGDDDDLSAHTMPVVTSRPSIPSRPATPATSAPAAAVAPPTPVVMSDEDREAHEAMLREMDELRSARR